MHSVEYGADRLGCRVQVPRGRDSQDHGLALAGQTSVRRLEFHQPPQPSDHVLAQLKAGETGYQAGELPETPRVSKIHHEPFKTVCKTLSASIFLPSMERVAGLGDAGLRGVAADDLHAAPREGHRVVGPESFGDVPKHLRYSAITRWRR